MSENGWYWCIEHDRVEPAEGCRAAQRMGPYPTREAAASWKARVETRNETWDDEDERWEEGT